MNQYDILTFRLNWLSNWKNNAHIITSMIFKNSKSLWMFLFLLAYPFDFHKHLSPCQLAGRDFIESLHCTMGLTEDFIIIPPVCAG